MRPVKSRMDFSAHNGTRALLHRQKRRRKDAQDRPCPVCSGEAVATRTFRIASGLRIQHRVCAKRHSSWWDADTGGLVGLGFGNKHRRDGTPLALPGKTCYFPGCKKPRKSKDAGLSRWCQGHEKQKYRHGIKGMKPLRGRHGKILR